MDNSAKNEDFQKQVRERLLDVAEEVFAEKGYAGTSVRELTCRAKCNLAAVNYHFGSKENLYAGVFQRRMQTLRRIRLESIERVMAGPKGEVTLEQLLHAFAVAFTEPLLDESLGRRFMKLMIREMLNPNLPRSMFADEMAIPTISALGKALSEVCPDLKQKETIMCVLSLIGQLMHAVHLNEVFRTEENITLPIPSFSEMVEHIVQFSAAGIREMAGAANK